ncbi:MAG: hypothetical protein A2341_19450 [Deltaproteobacteria bacterium RIFOXYB12_FULL_58_9]|nr:MAG: hypothetical protein A2341_19450 [Deltaproteobacteria bacterium RIFOXYB12_FULL_58_9]
MGDLAASGGYFVAMEANHIVAQPGTLTGSIGVYAGRFNLKEFWNHWFGVTFDGYETTDNAAFYSWLEDPSEVNQKRVDEFLDRVYDDFVTKAAAGRSMERDTLEPLARGRVWTGAAAKELGLVDSIGDMQVAIAELKNLIKAPDADVNLRVFPAPKTTFEILTEAFSQTAHAVETLHRGAQFVESVRAGREPGLLSMPIGLQIR